MAVVPVGVALLPRVEVEVVDRLRLHRPAHIDTLPVRLPVVAAGFGVVITALATSTKLSYVKHWDWYLKPLLRRVALSAADLGFLDREGKFENPTRTEWVQTHSVLVGFSNGIIIRICELGRWHN